LNISDTIYIDGVEYMIEYINQNSCGTRCVTLSKSFVGPSISSGYPVVYVLPSSDKHVYSEIVDDLIPGVSLYFRVTAINSYGYSQAAYYGYPTDPVAVTPISTPSSPLEGILHVFSPTAVRVEYTSPEIVANEGVNGAPITGYQTDIATGVYEVQTLSVVSSSTIVSGQYKIQYGY